MEIRNDSEPLGSLQVAVIVGGFTPFGNKRLVKRNVKAVSQPLALAGDCSMEELTE